MSGQSRLSGLAQRHHALYQYLFVWTPYQILKCHPVESLYLVRRFSCESWDVLDISSCQQPQTIKKNWFRSVWYHTFSEDKKTEQTNLKIHYSLQTTKTFSNIWDKGYDGSLYGCQLFWTPLTVRSLCSKCKWNTPRNKPYALEWSKSDDDSNVFLCSNDFLGKKKSYHVPIDYHFFGLFRRVIS